MKIIIINDITYLAEDTTERVEGFLEGYSFKGVYMNGDILSACKEYVLDKNAGILRQIFVNKEHDDVIERRLSKTEQKIYESIEYIMRKTKEELIVNLEKEAFLKAMERR